MIRYSSHISNNRANNVLIIWLIICICTLFFLIGLGGYTRLIGAGLSITEWKPITGIIFPLSTSAWQEEFIKYQQSPEYRLINYSLSIADFKFLYLIEYFHRLLARGFGIIYLLPFLFFYYKGNLKHLKNKSKYTLWFIPFLGILQAIIGWYMVKSGLNTHPEVSHILLATHLTIGAIIYSLLIKQLISLVHYKKKTLSIYNLNFGYKILVIICINLVLTQIFLGGMAAGLGASLVYNTFPMMGDSLIPQEMYSIRLKESIYNPVSIQFFHRICAYLIAAFSILLSFKLYRDNKIKSLIILSLIGIQIFLGASILIQNTSFILTALIHQIVAFIILGFLIALT